MRWDMILKMAKEEGRKEGFEIGLKKVREEHLQFIIMNMVEMHMPLDTIAEIVGQSPQYVQQVIDGMQIPQPANR